MIGVYGEEQLIRQVVEEGVLHVRPCCQNVVVPPAFNEGKLVAELVRRLRAHPRKPMVASCALGQFRGVQDYVVHAHEQWSETYRLPRLRSRGDDLTRLRYLLSSLPDEPPAIHLLHGFHHAVEKLGQEALNIIGECEDSDETPLQAIAVTPYRITTMKEIWRKQSRERLTISRYGDKHRFRIVQPWPHEKLLAVLIERGIPHGPAEWFIGISGGYPDPLNAVIGEWEQRGGPVLTGHLRRELQEIALDAVRTFVEYLDLPASHTRRRVADVMRTDGREGAASALANHPWKTLLLDDDANGLRAESVGLAVTQSIIDDGERQTESGSLRGDVVQEAERMYRRRQYDAAARILLRFVAEHQPPRIALLTAHSQIMASLFRGDAPGEIPEGVNLSRAIAAARETAITLDTVPERRRRTLERRYLELERMATAVQTARRASEKLGVPTLDFAAGLVGDGPLPPQDVVLLLGCMAESGRALAADASACMAVIALVEQLFRIWAWWELKLNCYRAPDDVQQHWAEAEAACRRIGVGPAVMGMPAVGSAFPSDLAFACYALTVYRNSGQDAHSPTQADTDALMDTLALHARVKNPPAEPVVVFSREVRRLYFEAIDRWLTAALKACPDRVTREEVMAVVAPLPLLDERGSLTAVPPGSGGMTARRDELTAGRSQAETVGWEGAAKYDVFLSYNTKDKQAVIRLANRLKARGMRVWFDGWELRPGETLLDALERIITECRTAAVCIGDNGLGPWQRPEVKALLSRFINAKKRGDDPVRVIPVLLPSAPQDVEVPLFLTDFATVDLRNGIREQGLDKLEWGITGIKPLP